MTDRLNFPMLHGAGGGSGLVGPSPRNRVPQPMPAGESHSAAARRLQLIEEFGSFIRDRLHRNSSTSQSNDSTITGNDVPPILHRGYSSSNSRAGSISSMQAEAHVSRLAHDFVAEKRASAPPSVEHSPITTGAIEAIRHIAGDIREITTSTTLNVGMTRRDRPQHMMPPPASPSTPTQDLVASTSAQGRAHVSTIALVKIGGSLESAAASPTGALTTNQVNAPSSDPVANTANPTTTTSLAVTNKLSAPRAPPSRSPSPSDPLDAHSWPAPAAAPAPRAQPLVAPLHTPPAHMTSDSAYDGHLPSLEPRSPPRTRVLEELYTLRAENAKLRAAEQDREREGAALAAEVGNLERELQEKTAACETLENTVLDLKNARDVLQAELHQAKREVANGASMYGHALQKMEAMQIEASQREEAFMAQMEQLREDLRETLDFAQTEASTSQRMIDILTAELTMLRAERRSEAHQRKTSSRASIAEGTSHAPNVSGIISSSSSSTVAAPTEEVTAQNSSSEGSSLASSLRRDLLGPTGEVDANQPHDDSLVAALLATPPRDEDSERDRSCMETPSDDVSIVIVSPENPHDDPGDTKVTDVVAHIHLSPMYHVSPPRAIEPRVPGGSFDLGSPNSQSTHSQFTLGSFSVAPMMPMVEVGYSTTATQTRIPIVADAHIGVSLSLDPDTSLLHNSPAGGVDKAALDAIMSPQGDDQRVDKLNAELAETRTRATEATQQWAKWVEQCAKTNAVLAKERQFREALELEHDKLKGFVTALPSTMDGSASVVGLYTEADLRRAVDAARDESLHLAAEVAEFCMQVLEDVKAGRRAL